MTQGIKRFVIVAAIAAVLVITGGTTAWAQCPSSPSYTPDFSNPNTQTCLTLTGTPAMSGYPGFFAPASTLIQPNGTPNPAQPAPGVATVLRLTPNSTFTSGSAWYNTQQPVSGTFSTTFTFQLSGANGYVADGFAFVIQNSSVTALDPDNGADGCSLGFGDAPDGSCTSTTGGITNSLAVEFDTYQNFDIDDPNGNHVAIQSCGMAANSVEAPPLPGSCQIANNSLVGLLDPRGNPLNLADGYPHTVTITYTPSTLSNCGPQGISSCSTIDVLLDNNDLFPANSNPVFFSLNSIGLNSGNAWVGFTGTTGGGNDNQDILSWTFTPQAQSAVISQNAPATLNFTNASGTPNVYSYTAQLTAPYATPEIQVQPILMTQAACDALVQVNFWPARCFVYANAEGTGENMSVMFSVTCPTSPNGVCGNGTNFDATLGTVFNYVQSENPFFVYPGILGLLNPFPGWLKGGTGTSPCTPIPNTPLFQSNQIGSFIIDNGVMKGGSGGGASCWTATYDTPGEIWPGISISSPTFTTYKQGQVVTANYTCTNPATSKPLTSPTGPYLTVASCTQGTGNQTSCSTNPTTGAITCTGSVPTSKKGLQIFEVTSLDSGQNQNVDLVIYNVK